MKELLPYLLFIVAFAASAQTSADDTYWRVSGRQSIVWQVSNDNKLPHADNMEMAGRKVAAIVAYNIDKKRQLSISRDIIFPQLRTLLKTNDPEWREYRAYFRYIFTDDLLPRISFNRKILIPGPVDSVEIEGQLVFYHAPVDGLQLTRTLVPSMEERMFTEIWQLSNTGNQDINLQVGNVRFETSEPGYKGIYHLRVNSDAVPAITIKSGKSYRFGIYYTAQIDDEPAPALDFHKVEQGRLVFLDKMKRNLVLETPDEVLNTLFYFSKIRAAENLFDSEMGLVHSPGGGNYYVGVWANDQAEYSGPFFPQLGYEPGERAAINAYMMFSKNIPEEGRPISSSFEMEGLLPCCGKDRGDAAMIAYGASHYALLMGDDEITLSLWSLITWCLDYCQSHRNDAGAVMSETDEMEGRIETGNANLATSSLYYGALGYAASLAKEMNRKDLAREYLHRRENMAKVIENYFGASVNGLDTYRYFKENNNLRHWICMPLVVGINKRAEATTKALLDRLWTENGVLVELNPESEREKVFWDRGTLYTLRGTFRAGAADKSMEKLQAFSRKRLLGDHVPYVVEAWPENNMRHLSAESALYCRIFTEGILGIVPTGYRSMDLTPRLPEDMDYIRLSDIHMENTRLTFLMEKKSIDLHLVVTENGKDIYNNIIRRGETVSLVF